MNERIQELAYDAEDYDDTIVDGGGEFHPTFVKKFAELIIRECVLISRTSTDGFSAGRRMEEYFGVESAG